MQPKPIICKCVQPAKEMHHATWVLRKCPENQHLQKRKKGNGYVKRPEPNNCLRGSSTLGTEITISLLINHGHLLKKGGDFSKF